MTTLKCKFNCIDKDDFIRKCKFAKVTDKRFPREVDRWMDGSLTGSSHIWTVDIRGDLACYGYTYAEAWLQDVPDITNLQITLGEL